MATILELARNSEMNDLRNDTYELVSTVAYLIGVPKRFFESEYDTPDLAVYTRLDTNKNARIIRHLCVIRTAIEQNFRKINDKMKFEYRSILSIPECIPPESIAQLNLDGIDFIKKSSTKLTHHLIEINRLINDRINNCKSLFPLWLNWSYLKDLFIMPDGLTEEGTKNAAALYYANKALYPFRMYINWTPSNQGNILYNDRKFTRLLYEWNNDYFSDESKVSDAGEYVKDSIYDFLNNSKQVVVVVDCENSDPYKLCATLKSLDQTQLASIDRILLFDDANTVSTWKFLDYFTSIPVEHMLIDRVKQNKSLVDIRLTARACQEHYQNHVDSFIILSSDSDYWGLISALPEARFLVMLEHDKCGPDIKNALLTSGIFYCYIDDFYSGNAEDIKHVALLNELQQHMEQALQLNVNAMMDSVLHTTRLTMSQTERRQFMDKYLRNMKLRVDDAGDLHIELPS